MLIERRLPVRNAADRGHHPAGVDPQRRHRRRVVEAQVGGREAELATPPVAGHHRAHQVWRHAEPERRGRVAGADRGADAGRRDDLAVHLDRLHHDHLEAALARRAPASARRVPPRLRPKALRRDITRPRSSIGRARGPPGTPPPSARAAARRSGSARRCRCPAPRSAPGSRRAGRGAARTVPGRSSSSGGGSKTSATLRAPCSAAAARGSPPRIARWPRCTPSKTPSVTTAGPIGGSSSRPRARRASVMRGPARRSRCAARAGRRSGGRSRAAPRRRRPRAARRRARRAPGRPIHA